MITSGIVYLGCVGCQLTLTLEVVHYVIAFFVMQHSRTGLCGVARLNEQTLVFAPPDPVWLVL